MNLMIRQPVPVSVRLTGKVNRWATPDPNVWGAIGDVEIEVEAAGYEGKTLWIESYKLMFPNWEDVGPDALEQMCRVAADVRIIADVLCTYFHGPGWSAEQLQHHCNYALMIADIFVQAAYGRNELPVDLVERVRKAGKLGDAMYGVSLYAILEDLDKGTKPWDETLAEVQCPLGTVDDFAEASIDAAMAVISKED